MPRHLLLINPNTTTAITDALAAQVQAASPAHVQVHATTAAFGAPYIADEAGYAVAAHAVLHAWKQAADAMSFDRIIIGCFGDPGLFALRDLAGCPVTGLAEAAVAEAAATAEGHGRYAIVTGGAAWEPMLRKLLPALAGGEQLAAIETVALTGAQLRADPIAGQTLLLEACRKVQREHRVDAVIPGGAALGGLAAALQPSIDVPLIDSVQAAARHVWQAPPSSDQGCPTWL